MIPDQRHLFDLPDDHAYLNCAYTAPLLKAAARAGIEAIEAKRKPWKIKVDDFFSSVENLRRLFSQLVGCSPNDVAVVPAASYGIALAAGNLPVEANQSIVVLQDQFPSNVYSWMNLAARTKAKIKTVLRPPDGDWTTALLEGIDDNTAIVATANNHWTDGTVVDLVRVGEKCRAVGAAFVLDGAQFLGAVPFSVADVRPDFLAAISHKWLLGPYSMGFCYVDPKWQDGTPLEENWFNRAGSEDFSRLVDYQEGYQPGARRYDVGEVSNFILSPIAAAALEQILDWGVDRIAATLRSKTDSIADRASEMGLLVAERQFRAPHMIGVTKPGGFLGTLPELLAQEKVYVSIRGESVRVAPHLYNNDDEIDRLFAALQKVV
jgi:selenocysteine lyase/cysteine desulfurase